MWAPFLRVPEAEGTQTYLPWRRKGLKLFQANRVTVGAHGASPQQSTFRGRQSRLAQPGPQASD